MTTPVSTSPIYQVQPTVTVQEEVQPVQDALVVESKEPQQPSLQKQFDKLMKSYCNIMSITAGCGRRAQGSIDAEYARLSKFANEHPEFKAQLPEKHIAYDDERGGSADGLASLGMNQYRRSDDCVIQ